MTAKSKKFQKTFEKVRLLSLATPRARKRIVDRGDRELVDSICECCVNILNGVIPLDDKQKTRLVKHKNRLRELALKKVSLRKKKEIVQSGGLLGAVLAPAVAFLGSLLFR